MKKIPAEKLNMVLALHYLHGLSRKQITRISGLHYTQVDSHIAKLDKQIASGELSRDDIMASAESANKRLGLEELVAKDGEKDMKVKEKKLVEEINADKKIHPILVSESLYNKMIKDVKETINYTPDQNVKPQPKSNFVLPEDFAKKHVSDTRCIIPGQEHYAISVLESLIQRIRNRSIFITCLSISEEDFSTLSINWRSKNESK
jgi:hypothetical protein